MESKETSGIETVCAANKGACRDSRLGRPKAAGNDGSMIKRRRNTNMKRLLTFVMVAVLCLTALPAGFAEGGLIEPVGTTTGAIGAKGVFYTDYDSFGELEEAAREVAVSIASEGITLLKNDNGALPLTTEKKVTVFGSTAANYVHSGSGSGAGSPGTNGIPQTTVAEAFEMAGLKANPKTLNVYARANASRELGMEYYSGAVTATYKNYHDAAILWLSRTAGEAGEMPSHDVPGHSDPTDHNLMLQDNEKALIKHIKEYFPDQKIIAIINSSNIMQIPELAEERTADNLGVDAILWVGGLGNNGIDALGKILTGEINPSGHTVDLWAKDFKQMPTWTNVLDQTQHVDENGERMNARFYYNGEQTGYYTIEYREGIYMGYRFYETKAADMEAETAGAGEAWYNDQVLYPYGFGLSYTAFDWKLEDVAAAETIDAANREINIRVAVTNTGSVPGKDLVQVYVNPPYTKGGIEKASANLVGYAKTKLLQPGETETVTVSFAAQNMASFDWNDANGNGFKGYELEKGDYIISVNRNSHTIVDCVVRTVVEDIQCKTDLVTGSVIEPLFVDQFTTVNDSLLSHMISRATGLEQPAVATVADRTLTDEQFQRLENELTYRSYDDKETDPWYVKEVPDTWTQAVEHEEGFTDVTVKLAEMAGITYNESTIVDGVVTVGAEDAENTRKWDEFKNQLTWQELCDICNAGTGTLALPSIGKEADKSTEGPVQIGGGTLFPSNPILAATWNKDLAYAEGLAFGNEALFLGKNEWHGPAMNTHRHPLCGRNFEYYSEDGIQGALIAEQVVKGATEKGLLTYLKHFFLNDQESHRMDGGGVATFATEQAMREIYLRTFEHVVKNGGTAGIMSSFNRLGWEVAGTNWASHRGLLRNEWGFRGATVTDAWVKDYCPADLLVRAGDEAPLGIASSYPMNSLHYGAWDETERDGKGLVLVAANADDEKANVYSVPSLTHYYAVRRSAQAILYTRVNSSANNNGFIGGSIVLDTSFDIEKDNSFALSMPGFIDAVFSLSEEEVAKLPAGVTFNDVTATFAGKPEADTIGDYAINVNVTCDGGRVSSYLTLNLKVQDKWHVNGVGIENDTVTVESGKPVELKIDCPAYGYTTGGYEGRYCLVGYGYDDEGTAWSFNEDRWFADLVAQDKDSLVETFMVSFDLYVDGNKLEEGETFNGLTFTQIVEEWIGQGIGRGFATKGYDIVTGAKVEGTPEAAGTYQIKVVINAPMTGSKFAGSYRALFPSAYGTPHMTTFEKEFTLEIK